MRCVTSLLLLSLVWVTVAANSTIPSPPSPAPPGEMLSFEEWRKKIAEINDDAPKQAQATHPIPPQESVVNPNVKKTNGVPKRIRNFASSECGSKVVAANPEAESVMRILNEQADEYMLNPCKVKIWFVVELCETVKASQLELANFELFSSIPKEFSIYASDHYPTREWTFLGSFSAADSRNIQTFDIKHNGFAKYFKIELNSHYGSEHFCPLSVVRIFGTSLFEEVERMDNDPGRSPQEMEEPMMPEGSSVNEEALGAEKASQNLLGTARDAVFSIVKKAADALNGNSKKTKTPTEEAEEERNKMQEQKRVIKLFEATSRFLSKCTSFNETHQNSTLNSDKICFYLQALFGERTFYSLMNETKSFKSGVEFHFKCSVINNITNKIVDNLTLEPSIANKVFNGITTSVEELSTVPMTSSLASSTPLSLTSEMKETSKFNLSDEVTPIETIDVSLNSSSDSLPPVSKDVVSNETITNTLAEESNDNSTVKNESNDILVKSVPSIPNQNESTQSTQNIQTPINGHHVLSNSGGQTKESVVIRLSNRIKALEVNLSLSSQYLEELSQRYRRQMEEMQQAFSLTISNLNDTAKKAAEKDAKQQEAIQLLESKLNDLNGKLNDLLSERENFNWYFIELHIILMITEVVVVVAIIQVCVRLKTPRTVETVANDATGKTDVKSNNSLNTPVKRPNPNPNHTFHLPAKRIKRIDDTLLNATLLAYIINLKSCRHKSKSSFKSKKAKNCVKDKCDWPQLKHNEELHEQPP